MGRKALLDGDSETVILSCCAPVQRVAGGCVAALDYRCEAAGWAFTRRYEAGEADEASESSDADATPSGGAEDYGREKEKKAAAGYLKISELLKGVQLYELMGISEGASQEEIKKAYRTLALSAHPDKQAAMEPEEAKKVEENFIKIQEAYELLSDPVKRKQYDSSLDFDDALPRLRKGDDFFKVFGEAFRRNARFSVKRPVPELGAKEDEPKVWKRFYDFWDNFQSWRDPVMLAQKAGEEICDLAEAECREERRWMVRENERVARKYKQQERERIAKLVSLAESSDPRVQAEKDAKRLAREAEQAKREEERNAVRRAKEEAEKRQREEEEAKQRALEQKRKEEKAAREAVKERVKKCRQRLRGFHQAVREHVVLEQLNEVCVQLSEEELRALGDQLELALKAKAVEKAVRLLHEAIEAIGLVPMKVQVEEASTTSGPGSEEDNTQRRLSPEEEELERQRQAEKARLAAERAEEKKKKEEQRKKEQAAAEAAKRQQEKKEEQKAKKASEKQKKQEEQDKLRKEQQREESRLKAQEQSERDKQLAQQKKQEMELERAVQAFSQDRVSRLTRLEALSDEQLLAQLAEATEADATLGAALQLLKASGDVEKGMALVHHIGVAWGLGLQAPLRMENAVRNRVKKGRKRLTDSLAAFLKASETFEGTATAWQRGIVEGSIEVPVWEPAEEAEEAPKEAPKEKKKAKKEKNDEDLDQILAELDTPAKGSKKSKKK